MNLEGRIANWVELGVMPYKQAMDIQRNMVEARKKDLIADTILSVQHPLTISFGADEKNNQFSAKLLQRVAEKYGSASPPHVERYLMDNCIPFDRTGRGGGATVFAPGQFLFYPIVDHSQITGSHLLDLGAYKLRIYKTMFEALANLGVDGINTGSDEAFRTRDERRDVWINRGGITHKMGSKGVTLNGKVAYNGFALYVDEDSIENNWMVNQCGYTPDQVKLWTLQQELGRKVSPEEVYDATKKSIMKNFGYSAIQENKLTKPEIIEGIYGN